MQAIIEHQEKKYKIDFGKPLDISIAMRSGLQNPNAFGIQPPLFTPFVAGSFIGSVAQGGSVNCENLTINAHGNGTHTECVGHISLEKITINSVLTQFVSVAQIISITPQHNCIEREQVQHILQNDIESLIIRTLPNETDKCAKNYSGNNPAYLSPTLCKWLAEKNIKHLLVDLPSVDPEHDEGKLSAHHAFWQYPSNTRLNATITEMIFVPTHITDGIYLLNLQIASLETDASPSKPILYALHKL